MSVRATTAASARPRADASAEARRALERAWAPRRVSARDLRAAMFRKWRRTYELDLAEVDGGAHLVVHACAPPPADERALARRLAAVAARLNALNAGALVREMLEALGPGDLPGPGECAAAAAAEGCGGEGKGQAVVLIDLGVSEARAREFDTVA